MLRFPIKTPISLEPTKNLSVKPCSAHFCSLYDLIHASAGARAQLRTPALAQEACPAWVKLGDGFGEVVTALRVPTTSLPTPASRLGAKKACTSLHAWGARGVPGSEPVMIDYTTALVKIIVFFISTQMNYFSKKPFVLNAICLQYGANQLQRHFCAEID